MNGVEASRCRNLRNATVAGYYVLALLMAPLLMGVTWKCCDLLFRIVGEVLASTGVPNELSTAGVPNPLPFDPFGLASVGLFAIGFFNYVMARLWEREDHSNPDAEEDDAERRGEAVGETGMTEHLSNPTTATVSSLIDAYDQWDGEADTFIRAWGEYIAGRDGPCPEHPAGIHSTYLVEDGSCSYCGDKSRG